VRSSALAGVDDPGLREVHVLAARRIEPEVAGAGAHPVLRDLPRRRLERAPQDQHPGPLVALRVLGLALHRVDAPQQRDVLELDPDLLGDHVTMREDGDVFEQCLAAIAESRGLDGHAGEGAADLVHDQRRERLTLDVLGHDQEGSVQLRDLLEQGEQVLHGADALLVKKDEGLFEHGLHLDRVGDEIGREIPAVELHPLHHLDGRLRAFRFLDRDGALGADLFDRVRHELADGRIEHLGAEVLLGILQVHFLRDRDAVVADDRLAPLLLDQHAFRPGAERHADGVRERGGAAQHLLARRRPEDQLLVRHRPLTLSLPRRAAAAGPRWSPGDPSRPPPP
jgi:hypothetical protein